MVREGAPKTRISVESIKNERLSVELFDFICKKLPDQEDVWILKNANFKMSFTYDGESKVSVEIYTEIHGGEEISFELEGEDAREFLKLKDEAGL